MNSARFPDLHVLSYHCSLAIQLLSDPSLQICNWSLNVMDQVSMICRPPFGLTSRLLVQLTVAYTWLTLALTMSKQRWRKSIRKLERLFDLTTLWSVWSVPAALVASRQHFASSGTGHIHIILIMPCSTWSCCPATNLVSYAIALSWCRC